MTELELVESELKYCGVSIDYAKRHFTIQGIHLTQIRFDRCRLIYITEGYIQINIDRRSDVLKKGQIAFIPDQVSYEILAKPGLEVNFYECQFSLQSGKTSMSQYISFRNVFEPQARNKTDRLFKTLIKLDEPQNLGDVMNRMSTMIDLLLVLMPIMQSEIIVKNNGNTIDLMETARYIEEHLDSENLTVNDLARRINISERNFQRLFKEQFGITCREYIIQKKLQVFKKLLSEEDIPIHTIAEQYKFSDETSFSRYMKKYTGCYPGLYRKKHEGPI